MKEPVAPMPGNTLLQSLPGTVGDCGPTGAAGEQGASGSAGLSDPRELLVLLS